MAAAAEALDTQPLPSIPPATRLRWVHLLASCASVGGAPPSPSSAYRASSPLALARAIEHHAHAHRQAAVDIGDGVAVLRYGGTDLLLTEPLAAHVDAAAAHYCTQLRRAAWLLSSGCAPELLARHCGGAADASSSLSSSSSSSLSSSSHSAPLLLLQLPDDKIVECTPHAEWEREFYAKQERARSLLVSGRGAAPTNGIFACPRCASYDVDTEQKQTRSADEPMTIFCTCNSCGKRFIR